MKKLRRSPVMTGLLFIFAVILLFAGTVGGTQAALQVYSTDYLSAINLDHIGVTLFENGEDVSHHNYGTTAGAGFTPEADAHGSLILNDLGTDTSFLIGKKYDCRIHAQNTGTINQYVRVTIYKYWVDPEEPSNGKGWYLGEESTKITNTAYDPALIELSYNGSEYNNANWIKDTDSSTPEREIYYYRGMLVPEGETYPLFTHLAISSDVAKTPLVTTIGDTTYYTYAYDGLGFVVKAEVDAVQTHHAGKAIRSAWGLTDTGIMNAMGITNPNE